MRETLLMLGAVMNMIIMGVAASNREWDKATFFLIFLVIILHTLDKDER